MIFSIFLLRLDHLPLAPFLITYTQNPLINHSFLLLIARQQSHQLLSSQRDPPRNLHLRQLSTHFLSQLVHHPFHINGPCELVHQIGRHAFAKRIFEPFGMAIRRVLHAPDVRSHELLLRCTIGI